MTARTTDPSPEAVAALHDRIHAVLIREFGKESAFAMASALSYELVSMLAASPLSLSEAETLLRQITDVMHAQLRALGTGGYHP